MNIAVPKRTIKEINNYADKIKRFQGNNKFDVLKFLDQVGEIGIEYQIVPEKSKYLEYNEFAKYDILQRKIFIRERVYENAIRNVLQDLFTIAHEIGHAILHRNIALYRSNKKITKNYDPEWQADKFAARLLGCKEQKKIKEFLGIRISF